MASVQPRKVLVLGNDTRAFLTVIRSLGRRGIVVDAGGCEPQNEARWSRYVRSTPLNSCDADPEKWLDQFREVLRRESYQFVIPTNDSVNLLLQTHRREFDTLPIYLISDHAHRISSDKHETNALARRLGISLPDEVLIRERGEADELPRRFHFPIVLKPLSSCHIEDVGARRMVKKAYNERDLHREVDAMLRAGPILAQENFRGRGVGVEVLAHEGKILYAFQHERVHEPLMGGGSSYRKSVPLSPELLEATAQLMGALEYTGVAMVEFKVDPQTCAWVLIEINGRFWGSLPLAVAAGADFPFFLYEMWVEGRREFPAGYRHGVYCRNLIGDIGWWRRNWVADHGDATLATRPRWTIVPEMLRLCTFRDSLDTFVWDDAGPGWAELRKLSGRITDPLGRRIRYFWWSRPWVRYRLRSDSQKKLTQANSILFVCKGNICRSPFAAAYARSLCLEGLQVASCGFIGKPNRAAPPHAIAAARHHGIDLAAHRSTVIDEQMVESAGLIIVFDAYNYDALGKRFPTAKDKTILLGWLARAGPLAVDDPYGGPLENFDRCYARIVGILTATFGPKTESIPAGTRSVSFPGILERPGQTDVPDPDRGR